MISSDILLSVFQVYRVAFLLELLSALAANTPINGFRVITKRSTEQTERDSSQADIPLQAETPLEQNLSADQLVVFPQPFMSFWGTWMNVLQPLMGVLVTNPFLRAGFDDFVPTPAEIRGTTTQETDNIGEVGGFQLAETQNLADALTEQLERGNVPDLEVLVSDGEIQDFVNGGQINNDREFSQGSVDIPFLTSEVENISEFSREPAFVESQFDGLDTQKDGNSAAGSDELVPLSVDEFMVSDSVVD